MADYAFLDEERTKRINANQPDIKNYKNMRLFCKNPHCDAHMYIHNPEIPEDAYFQSHGAPSHSGYCGCQGAMHFNRVEFDESGFIMPDAIKNLITANDDQGSADYEHGQGERINIYPPRTVRQIYQMCVNIPSLTVLGHKNPCSYCNY